MAFKKKRALIRDTGQGSYKDFVRVVGGGGGGGTEDNEGTGNRVIVAAAVDAAGGGGCVRVFRDSTSCVDVVSNGVGVPCED